jgi:geranylgeranyl pyrophosphate synthase
MTPSLLQNLWQRSLLTPWQDIDSRPKKEIRGQFVQLGYLLSGGDLSEPGAQEQILLLTKAIETLHLGSLIIDDIEDNSATRRSGPTLHRRYGVPVALNVGNFLYFETFDQIRRASFTEEQKLKMYEVMIETMWQGHRGQALDLSVRIDDVARAEVANVCMKSLELKSGVLMALSLRLGCLIAEKGCPTEKVTEFGIQFGMTLQMFDDIENLRVESQNPKHLEDLILRRPSFVWVTLAEECSSEEWQEFREILRDLPETKRLGDFLRRSHLREKSLAAANRRLKQILVQLKNDFRLSETAPAYVMARGLGEKLSKAYQVFQDEKPVGI